MGDPFTEKLLLEASLELILSGHIVAIQDMGAAGLTSSSAEMAARGDVGVTIDVTKVPVRETGMTPYEILLSESQERMLVVARRGHEDAVRAILAKWDLAAAVIGSVIAEPVYRVTEGERVVAEFPGSQPGHRLPELYARRTRRRADRRGTRDGRLGRPASPRGARPHLDAPRTAVVADDREQGLGHAPVRHIGSYEHRRSARGWRRGRRAAARN